MLKINRIITALSAALATVLLTTVSFAAEYRLDDKVKIFPIQEKKQLQTEVEALAEHTGWNVIILTSGDVGENKRTNAVLTFANDYYVQKYGADTDGIILLYSTETDNYYISANGFCADYLTNERIAEFFDSVRGEIKSNNHGGVVSAFCEKSAAYFDEGSTVIYEEAGLLRIWSKVWDFVVNNTVVVIIAAAVIVIAACAAYILVKNKYMLCEELSASEYFLPNSLSITASTDTLTMEYTIANNNRSRTAPLHSEKEDDRERLTSLYDSFNKK